MQSQLAIYEQLLSYFEGAGNRLHLAGDIKSEIASRYGTNPTSVIPSDYCYNRWNYGVTMQKPIFVRVGFGEYRFIGPAQPYSGLIYGRPRGTSTDQVVGEWVEGRQELYDVVSETSIQGNDAKPAGRKERTLPLSPAQLDLLYEKYMDILTLEVQEFGCKPTETRHLIGRIGEFYCARRTDGQLASRANQEGFDVVSGSGKRISVKTTAQKSGFVSINSRTLKFVDELMLVRYDNGAFEEVYFGDIQVAVDAARTWKDRFELDIAKARRLPSEQ